MELRVEDIHPAEMNALLGAVFKQAVKDYVKIVASGEERLNYIGSKKEIEKYLDSPLAYAGTTMYVPDVKKKLKAMTQEEAIEYEKALRCNRPPKGAAM
jgi:hypothetical protein